MLVIVWHNEKLHPTAKVSAFQKKYSLGLLETHPPAPFPLNWSVCGQIPRVAEHLMVLRSHAGIENRLLNLSHFFPSEQIRAVHASNPAPPLEQLPKDFLGGGQRTGQASCSQFGKRKGTQKADWRLDELARQIPSAAVQSS